MRPTRLAAVLVLAWAALAATIPSWIAGVPPSRFDAEAWPTPPWVTVAIPDHEARDIFAGQAGPLQTPQPTAAPTPTPRPKPRPKPAPPKVTTPTVAAARAYARDRIGAAQYECLDVLWQHESGWNPRALNASSGAYGIPQALPGTKMATIAADWRTNPVTQVRWGLGYIAGRYGTACNAWAHFKAVSWY